MAVTTGTYEWFDDGKKTACGVVNGGVTDIRCLLLLSTYTFDATDEFVSDLTPGTHEVTAGGYARYTFTTEAVSEPTAGTWMFDAESPVWSVTGTNLVARRFVVYAYNAADASARLICAGLLDNADADVTTTVGNDLTINIDANGLFRAA